MINTILLVCTGNTCRSSMAEGLFKKIIMEDEELKNLEVLSAGTHVYFSTGATPEAIKAVKELNVDIKEHKSTQISTDLIEKADLILTMTENHKLRLIGMSEKASKKVFTLKEFVSETHIYDLDILDPFGMPLDEYKKCASEIQKLLLLAKDKIKEMKG